MALPDDIARTHSIADHALAKIKANELAAFPPNFEIWFAYAAGFNPALNKRINAILREGRHLTQDELEAIRDEFFGSGSFEERVDEVGGKLSGKVTELMGMINDAAGQTSGYSEELRGASKSLAKSSDTDAVRSIVTGLIEKTDEAEKLNRSMSNKLLESEQEIATLKEALESVRYEAMTDQLTGIGNRKRFDRAIEEAITNFAATGEAFGLMVADIDHFKKFNDTHGHQTGDQVLRLVASTLKALVETRGIACRYGGEEFTVILPGASLAETSALAEEIRKAVMGKELVKRSTGETLGRVTISIGVAESRANDTIPAIIERADECLYAAKNAGRNRVITESQMPAGTDADAA
ncbi:MAG: GGDEF domain-containing protein [Pseudomonadota bacterium]